MSIKALMAIVFLFFSLNTHANFKNEATDTIPFIVYKANSSYSDQNYQQTKIKNLHSIPIVQQEASANNIPTSELQNLISHVREAVCNSVGDGDVRVWVSIDASGKVLGVGTSTQAGLEVTFHCKKK